MGDLIKVCWVRKSFGWCHIFHPSHDLVKNGKFKSNVFWVARLNLIKSMKYTKNTSTNVNLWELCIKKSDLKNIRKQIMVNSLMGYKNVTHFSVSRQNYRFKRKCIKGQNRMNIKNVWKQFIRIHSTPWIRHLCPMRTPLEGRNVENLSIISPPSLNIKDFI